MLRNHRRAIRAVALVAGAGVAFALVPGGSATAAPAQKGCENRTNTTVQALLECVAPTGAVEHLKALQAIADANGGTRAAGTPGYEASVDYVVNTLEAAGWEVTHRRVPVHLRGPVDPPAAHPGQRHLPDRSVHRQRAGQPDRRRHPRRPRSSGSATPAPAGARRPTSPASPPATSRSIQRGTCTFGVKAVNAAAAGAAGVIIFNQGNAGTADRQDLIVGTLGGPDIVGIPVVGASYDQGVALAQAGSTARVFVPAPEQRPQKNVIAELPGQERRQRRHGRRAPGLRAGGPGHQRQRQRLGLAARDRAEHGARTSRRTPCASRGGAPRRPGWSARPSTSTACSQAEKDRIALYLNFDMVASPNYIFMVYDGDESGFPAPVAVPAGSVAIEDLFESYFTKVREARTTTPSSADAATTRRSSTTASRPVACSPAPRCVKTAEQQAIWGGAAGEAVRPVLPPGVRHARQRQHQGARRQHRRHRPRRARVLLLDARP